MITERTIVNALIIGASLILVPFVVSSALTVEYGPALVLGGFFAIAGAFFFLRDTLCIWPLLGSSIIGFLAFLPLPLAASDIFSILLILYYITGYVIIRQRRITVGKPRFLWPIVVVTAILLYHNHSLSIGILGGSTEGGKAAIMIYLAVLAYFCGINVRNPSVNFLSRVPLYAVILTAVTSIPYFLSTYIPSLAPLLYSATGSVNVGAYVDSQSGGSSESGDQGAIGRFAVFGPLGGALEMYLLSHYPIGSWIRPERWWVFGLSILCAFFAVSSGYRSVLFGFAFMIFAATWCHYSWRSLWLPFALLAGVFVVVAASNNNIIYLPVNKLPKIAQRTMSFLPLDWDESAIASGKSSNHFRTNIQDVYIKEYMGRSPLVGNGFYINTKEFDDWSLEFKKGGSNVDANDYAEAKTFIEGKLYHTGWISVYDSVGIIGFIAFLALGWSEMRTAAHFVLGPKANRKSSLFPLYVWILVNITAMMVTFFTVFGDFKATFINLCIYGIVLSQLCDIESTTEVPVVPRERKDQFEFPGLKTAQYGYQAKR